MQGTTDSTFPISAITRYQIPNNIFLATLQKIIKANHVQLSTVHSNLPNTDFSSISTYGRICNHHFVANFVANLTLK